MTRSEKRLLAERDLTLDGALLITEGVALNESRTALRDASGAWWPIAWSSHLGRYESSVGHVEAILQRAYRELS